MLAGSGSEAGWPISDVLLRRSYHSHLIIITVRRASPLLAGSVIRSSTSSFTAGAISTILHSSPITAFHHQAFFAVVTRRQFTAIKINSSISTSSFYSIAAVCSGSSCAIASFCRHFALFRLLSQSVRRQTASFIVSSIIITLLLAVGGRYYAIGFCYLQFWQMLADIIII